MRKKFTFFFIIIITSIIIPCINARAQSGNADITRKRNLQGFKLEINNLDVKRSKNLLSFKLEYNDAHVIRYRNMQGYELIKNDAHVIRYRNIQHFQLVPVEIDYQVDILNVFLTDQSGNPSSNFVRGDVVEVYFTVRNGGAFESIPIENGLVSVLVEDSAEIPMFLTYVYIDLPRDTSEELIFGYRVPLEGPIGVYTVRIMMFTNWPSQGGLGLAVQEATFSVS